MINVLMLGVILDFRVTFILLFSETELRKGKTMRSSSVELVRAFRFALVGVFHWLAIILPPVMY